MLGLFLGVCPLWGYQIILIIFFAALLKMNKAIALIAGHISIPPMIPLILYSSYYLGGLALNQETNILAFDEEFSLELLKDHMLQYVLGSFVLGILLAIVIGLITYLLLLIFRKKYSGEKEIT